MAIAVSAGTTTHALAQRLATVAGLTVVTNSIPVADVLYQVGQPDQTIILTGASARLDALAGPSPSPHFGPSTSTWCSRASTAWTRVPVHLSQPAEADTDRGADRGGPPPRRRHDHSNGGDRISSIARLDQADILITDAGIAPDARTTLAATVRDLVVVDVAPAPLAEVARAE
jgi:hypothetical protein